MREARIVLVTGKTQRNREVLSILAETFGGYTLWNAQGVWGHYFPEEVTVVEIAYEQSDENDRKLYDIASKYREDAKQVEVYLRYGNGHVQMVRQFGCMDNGEFDWTALSDALRRPKDDPEAVPAVPEHVAVAEKIPSSLDWE